MLLYGLEEDQDFQFLNRRQRTDIGPQQVYQTLVIPL
ncbi:hypothetical protein ALPO108162_17450 [Alicyclobacillus pomorum]